MRLEKTRAFLLSLMLLLVIGTSSCSSNWEIIKLVKDEKNGELAISLVKKGKLGVGHGGIGREILVSYLFDLKPIKNTYTDDEINLMRTGPNSQMLKPIKGTVTFNSDFSKATIDLQVTQDGQLVKFDGNGEYDVED